MERQHIDDDIPSQEELIQGIKRRQHRFGAPLKRDLVDHYKGHCLECGEELEVPGSERCAKHSGAD